MFFLLNSWRTHSWWDSRPACPVWWRLLVPAPPARGSCTFSAVPSPVGKCWSNSRTPGPALPVPWCWSCGMSAPWETALPGERRDSFPARPTLLQDGWSWCGDRCSRPPPTAPRSWWWKCEMERAHRTAAISEEEKTFKKLSKTFSKKFSKNSKKFF